MFLFGNVFLAVAAAVIIPVTYIFVSKKDNTTPANLTQN
jgi:hypothetical protein